MGHGFDHRWGPTIPHAARSDLKISFKKVKRLLMPGCLLSYPSFQRCIRCLRSSRQRSCAFYPVDTGSRNPYRSSRPDLRLMTRRSRRVHEAVCTGVEFKLDMISFQGPWRLLLTLSSFINNLQLLLVPSMSSTQFSSKSNYSLYSAKIPMAH